MKQTAVEWLAEQMLHPESHNPYIEQALEMERVQKSEEYLKGFKDGKEYQIKLDELTFKSE